MTKNFYKTLGVAFNASLKEIKKAYHSKIREVHPDTGNDKEKAKEINEAYEHLSNADKRTMHDEYLQKLQVEQQQQAEKRKMWLEGVATVAGITLSIFLLVFLLKKEKKT